MVVRNSCIVVCNSNTTSVAADAVVTGVDTVVAAADADISAAVISKPSSDDNIVYRCVKAIARKIFTARRKLEPKWLR